MRSDLRFLAAAFPLTSLYVGASAHAGQVLFDPPSATIDRTLGQTTATFAMSVDSDVFTRINSFDMVVGSDALLLVSLQNYPCTVFDCITQPANPPVYPSDLASGSFWFTPVTLPIFVGRLTVRAPDSLAPGTYEVIVDAARDSNRSVLGGATGGDPLFGRAVVNVVPEPATITLFALAAIAIGRPWRRRDRAGIRALGTGFRR